MKAMQRLSAMSAMRRRWAHLPYPRFAPGLGLFAGPGLLAPLWLLAGLGCESGPVSGPVPAKEPAAAEPLAPVPGATEKNTAAPAVMGETPKADDRAVSRYGGAIEPGPSVPLASLLSEPKAYAQQTVTTEGKVQRACSRKGCWMEIGEGDDACRVTFKDYAFFVPTDSAGAVAKIQGRLDTREVEAAAVDHLESEGARFRNKKPDGSATEVRLIASAVELRR